MLTISPLLLLILLSVCLSGTFACFGANTTATAASSVQFQNPPGTNYVRCITSSGEALCLTACTSGQTKLPSTPFGNYSSCLSYQFYYLCFSASLEQKNAAISDIFACASDIADCSTIGRTNYGPTFSSSSACQAAKPSNVVMCTDSTTTVFTCYYSQSTCPTGTLYIARGTTFSSLSACNNARPNVPGSWIRCMATVSSTLQMITPGGSVTITSTLGLPYCSYESCISGSDQRLSKSGVANWNSQNNCNTQLYWGYPCYCPLSPTFDAQPFYSLSTIFDHQNPNGALQCTTSCTNGLQLSPSWEDGPTIDAVNTKSNALSAYPKSDNTITHYRCKTASSPILPVCRPDYGGSTHCPSGETQLTTVINGVTSWLSLSACNSVRFWAYPCYCLQTVTDPYYSLTATFDHTITSGSPICSCTNGLKLSNGVGGANLDGVGAIATGPSTYPSPPTTIIITHYRCLSGGVPYCRPDYGSPQCPPGETKLLTPIGSVSSWSSLSACNLVRFASLECYSTSSSSLPPCQSDITSCPDGSVQLNPPFTSSDGQPAANNLCTGETTQSWTRCKTTAPDYVCRAYGSSTPKGCQSGETPMYPTTQGITLKSCKDNTPAQTASGSFGKAYVQCYTSTSQTNHMPSLSPLTSQMSCKEDTTGCGMLPQIPLGVNNVFSDDKCQNPVPSNTAKISWILCEVSSGTRPTGVDNTMLTCRPSNQTCNTWEIKRNAGTSEFSNVDECLLSWVNMALPTPRNVYCRCRIGSSGYSYNCGTWDKTMAKPTDCCMAANFGTTQPVLQIPNAATFYGILSNCQDSKLLTPS